MLCPRFMDGEAVINRRTDAEDRVFAMEHYFADYDRLDRKPRG